MQIWDSSRTLARAPKSAPCLCPRSLPPVLLPATFCVSKSIPAPFLLLPYPSILLDRPERSRRPLGMHYVEDRFEKGGGPLAPAQPLRRCLTDGSVEKGEQNGSLAPAQPLRQCLTDGSVEKGAKFGSLAPAQPLRRCLTTAALKREQNPPPSRQRGHDGVLQTLVERSADASIVMALDERGQNSLPGAGAARWLDGRSVESQDLRKKEAGDQQE